mmetsp:Transcript_23263/g.51059  ORF Transcript_23263/g.51059 Transcript_23263/m.51059 type:complete len:236 (+) Transcript_23263:979-1686(+)
MELGSISGLQLPPSLHRNVVQRLRSKGRNRPQGPQSRSSSRWRPAHGGLDEGGQALHVGLQRLRAARLGAPRRGARGTAEAKSGQGHDRKRRSHRFCLRRRPHSGDHEVLPYLRVGQQHQRSARTRHEAMLPRTCRNPLGGSGGEGPCRLAVHSLHHRERSSDHLWRCEGRGSVHRGHAAHRRRRGGRRARAAEGWRPDGGARCDGYGEHHRRRGDDRSSNRGCCRRGSRPSRLL